MNSTSRSWQTTPGAVGACACAGAGLVGEGLLAALFVLASKTMFRPVVNRINRRPVNEETSEAIYTVYVICRRDAQVDVRSSVLELLENATYPVRDVHRHSFGQMDAEIEATLYATAVVGEELDRVTATIENIPGCVAGVLEFWSRGMMRRAFGEVGSMRVGFPVISARALSIPCVQRQVANWTS